MRLQNEGTIQEYFTFLDRPKFKLLEDEDSHAAFLIDTSDSARSGHRLRDHPVFLGRSDAERPPTRLFVPRETVEGVRKEIVGAVGE